MPVDSHCSRLGCVIAAVYLTVVLIGCVTAAQRLAISIQMPGLAAIELVLLALPWSLLLEAPVLRETGLFFMALIVFGGVLLNTLLLYVVGYALQRWWAP